MPRDVEVAYLTGANRVEDGRGVAVADFGRDGHLDLLIQNLDKPAVLLMGRGEVGHWLELSLEGVSSNRGAVGAVAIAHIGPRRLVRQVASGSGFLSSSSPVLHFGLGSAERVERLEIRWPSGGRQVLEDVEADRRLEVREEIIAGAAR